MSEEQTVSGRLNSYDWAMLDLSVVYQSLLKDLEDLIANMQDEITLDLTAIDYVDDRIDRIVQHFELPHQSIVARAGVDSKIEQSIRDAKGLVQKAHQDLNSIFQRARHNWNHQPNDRVIFDALFQCRLIGTDLINPIRNLDNSLRLSWDFERQFDESRHSGLYDSFYQIHCGPSMTLTSRPEQG